ncbi:MAG: isoprenyl transferase [Verrucomicrobia bacterium]|nr:isoprenyl transferase [Verrucomicrobiota bacterium]
MDGNGRWARNRAFARIRGHRAGVESVRAVVRAAGEIGVEYLTLYAFSQENWSRPRSEVCALMRLLEKFLRNEIAELNENNVQLHAIGQVQDLSEQVRRQLALSQEATARNTGLKLILALSYGARREITRAAREIAREVQAGRVSPDEVDENLFARHLYTRDYPDPDLLIRTSGELRVSNFLLWQISYAEFVVSPVLWPDFRKEHFLDAVREYGRRQRRFGGVSSRG